jgi:hypothetical protein
MNTLLPCHNETDLLIANCARFPIVDVERGRTILQLHTRAYQTHSLEDDVACRDRNFAFLFRSEGKK